MKIKYFPSLTGIRGIAAFMVVLHHIFDSYFESLYLNAVLRELNVGVNMFFVLSGFFIWYRYSEQIDTSRKWLGKYLINRIARIFPVYFVLTTITMVLIYFLHNENLSDVFFTYFLNITLLNGLSSIYVYSGIPQGWTLSVEELFYISAPLLFILNIRYKLSLFYLGIGTLLMGLLLYAVFNEINFLGFLNDFKYIRITTYFGRFFEFFCGIILAKNFNKLEKYVYNKPVFTVIGSVLTLGSIFLVFPYLQTAESLYSIQTMTGYIYNVVVFPIIVAVLCFGLTKENSYLKLFLGSEFMNILGKSSYSLYLIHYGIIISVIFQFIPKSPILEVFIAYILSLFIWKFFEEPIYHKIRKLI